MSSADATIDTPPRGGQEGQSMSETTYLIRGASLMGERTADVLIRDGVIAEVGEDLQAPEAQEISGREMILLPGLVDVHTHLREPGREDAETVETGTRAAAAGGYTAVCAMANSMPVADSAGVVEQVYELGRAAGWAQVQPIGAVTVGLEGERLSEIGAMADSRARVRMFSDDGKCVHNAVLMRRALEYVKTFDGVVAQHAQEPLLTEGAQMNEGEVSAELGLTGWPAVAEESIIARDVLLAEHVGSRLHVCHLSTAGSVDIIRWAKKRGIAVKIDQCKASEVPGKAGGYDLVVATTEVGDTKGKPLVRTLSFLTGVGVVPRREPPNPKRARTDGFVRDGLFEFNPKRHDDGDKVFLGHTIKGRGLEEVGALLTGVRTRPG